MQDQQDGDLEADVDPKASLDPDFESSPPPRPTTPPVRMGFIKVLAFLSVLTAMVYTIPYALFRIAYAWESGRARAASESLARLDQAGVLHRASELFRLATHRVAPAAVNIQTFVNVRVPKGIGSGVVIDKDDGLVVTNFHVVRDSERYVVRFGRSHEIEADLVGFDERSDLAVLRVRGRPQVEAEWGDSDAMEIGEWVIAIGSPYALDRTVTAGIVSATGRSNLLGGDVYEAFIQTDAAINPGNSGGPLANLKGEVVGINTAIFRENQAQGIGLAIPSSMAKRVVEQIVKNGKVIRAYLGVMPEPLTPARRSETNLPSGMEGAYVGMLAPGGPAAKAGLKIGDVILSIDGKSVEDPSELRSRTFTLDIGKDVPLTVFRAGKSETLSAKIVEMPSSPLLAYLGFDVTERISVGPSSSNVVIRDVVPGGPADAVGLKPGQTIVRVGRQPIRDKNELDAALSRFTPAFVPLGIQRPDGRTDIITLGAGGLSPR